jgi:hypothetical protein
LTCHLNGNPISHITWMRFGISTQNTITSNDDKFTIKTTIKVDDNLKETSRSPTQMSAESILTIKDSQYEDEGVYYCLANDYIERKGKPLTKLAKTRLIIRDEPNKSGGVIKSKYLNSKLILNEFNDNNITNTTTSLFNSFNSTNSIQFCNQSDNYCYNNGICQQKNSNVKFCM